MGVANRDIRLENVLLGGDKKSPVIKLKEFRFSKSDLDSIPTDICGTLGYMAPEVLLGQEYDGKKADVWLCGVMLYAMLYGHYPCEDTREIVLQDIQIPDRPVTSPEVKQLIRSMVERDPAKRIRMEEICQQRWVAQGVPADFLSQNEEFVAASASHKPGQTKQEIDAILYEAGLETPEERRAKELRAAQVAYNSSGQGSGQDSSTTTIKDAGDSIEM